MPRKSWKNWAGTQECDCEIVEPKTLCELKATVVRAAGQGKGIRAAGRSYSRAPLGRNDGGTIVSVKALDGLLDFDPEANTVEVECGMSIEDLDAAVSRRGFPLVSPPIFPKPTVDGGAA